MKNSLCCWESVSARELPAGAAVTPGSVYSGAFVEMSAECCPCPAAVVTAPPLKQSLYLPVPPFFVSVLPPEQQGPITPSPGSFPAAEPNPNPTAFPLHLTAALLTETRLFHSPS